MDKIHYKELIEKYFEGNIADTEIKELSDWIKNDRQLQNWWEQEFTKSDAAIDPILRDKLFCTDKRRNTETYVTENEGRENSPYDSLEVGGCYFVTCLYCFFHLLFDRFVANDQCAFYCQSR